MVNFNGIYWEVLLVPPNYYALRNRDGTYSIGACDTKYKKIYIQNNLSPLKFRKVLAHEFTHAALNSFNIRVTDYQEELMADVVATYGQEIINNVNKKWEELYNL